MLNVFVISSDKRVASLIEYFQPFLKSKIRCASDFDNGLKEVFENRPSVVFIQSTIGTVSGETVSRHIKSLLGSASPRIVFMGDFDSSGKKGTSWCDDWICVSDSEQQMQQDFADLISRNFPEDWLEISLEMEKIASSSAGAIVDLPFLGKEISTEGISRQGKPAGIELEVSGESPDFSRPADAAAAAGAGLTGLQGKIVKEEAFPTYQKTYGDSFPEKIASKSKHHFAGKLFFGLFLLATAGSGIYFWLAREEGKTIPAVLPSASSPESAGPAASLSAKKKRGIRGLPAFVRSEWRDTLYTVQHPGWERYVSPKADIRIYRKNGMIKALQGISPGRRGFSDVYLTQMLNQAGIEGPLPSSKDSSENGFLVKTFVLPGIAELVTYQVQGSAQIKAFVLEFS
jgi:flagellar FliL protein